MIGQKVVNDEEDNKRVEILWKLMHGGLYLGVKGRRYQAHVRGWRDGHPWRLPKAALSVQRRLK